MQSYLCPVPCTAVNKVCASGIEKLHVGYTFTQAETAQQGHGDRGHGEHEQYGDLVAHGLANVTRSTWAIVGRTPPRSWGSAGLSRMSTS